MNARNSPMTRLPRLRPAVDEAQVGQAGQGLAAALPKRTPPFFYCDCMLLQRLSCLIYFEVLRRSPVEWLQMKVSLSRLCDERRGKLTK
jgi:hypothetical protein